MPFSVHSIAGDMLASDVGEVSDCSAVHVHMAVVCFIDYVLGDSRDVEVHLHEGLVSESLERRCPLIFDPHLTIHYAQSAA